MTFKNQVPLPRDYVLEVKVLLDFSIREWYISYSTVSPLTTGDSWDLLKSNYSSNYAKYCGSAFPDTSIISGCSLKISALRFLKTGNYNRRKTYHLLIFGKEYYKTNYIYIWTCQLLNINTEQYFVKYISYRQGVVYRTKHHQDLWQLMGRWWKCILSYPRKKKKKENLSSSHEEGIKTHRPETSRQQ